MESEQCFGLCRFLLFAPYYLIAQLLVPGAAGFFPLL